MKKLSVNQRGFTLIELLVVIAIISILSSIIYASLASAKTNAIDARKQADLSAMRTAMVAYNADVGRMPDNFDCSSGTCVVSPSRGTLEIQDAVNPANPTTESGLAYNASMQELVSLKYLSSIPFSPATAAYTYYDYGPGNIAGALVGTTLDGGTPSATGKPGSCRPFTLQGTFSNQDPQFNPGLTFLNELTLPSKLLASAELALGGLNAQTSGGTSNNLCSSAVSDDYCLCNPY